jgi:hypothetical protein
LNGRVKFRVVECHLDVHVPEIAAVKSLGEVHGLAERVAEFVEPTFPLKP